MTKHSVANLIEIIFKASPSNWIIELLNALPELLVTLLKNNAGISLERLQLVTIAITRVSVPQASTKTSFRNIRCGQREAGFLELSGELAISDALLLVTVSYFMRGQRQFFKPPDQAFLPLSEKKELAPLGFGEIREFLRALNQDNNFFYSEALARLNGRPKAPVPSQLILAGALALASASEAYGNFLITFHGAGFPDESLNFHYVRSNNGFYGAIFSQEQLLASVMAD